MNDFSIGRPSGRGYGFTSYQVHREGNRISIQPPDDGRRGGCRDGYQVSLDGDTIQVAGGERPYRIKLSPEGVIVDNPQDDGRRCGGADLKLTMPLKPEQYESVGLSVVSSLIGLPLPAALLQA